MPILAVPYPVFQHAMRIISSITNAENALVTTTFNHQYVTGMIVRLNIPQGYGMLEVNQKQGTITVISDTTFTIDIDTTYFNQFTTPSTFPDNSQYPQVVPVGEINQILIAATRNVLPYSAI